MKKLVFLAFATVSCFAQQKEEPPKVPAPAPAAAMPAVVTPASETEGSVTANGQRVDYKAVAGTLTVAADDAHDAQIALDGSWLPEAHINLEKPEEAPATARIFYTAYFKKGAKAEERPVTFLYNGGPGSSTMWLHMGSFGPKRVITNDTHHDPAAPYKITDNTYSLLDVSDVVFIDMPGAGFSRLFGKDKEKAFWGIDQDAHAFDRFIRRFLTKYSRWNSPKYLFGESYGTTRSAVLSNMLQNSGVDLNGVILLSQILNFADSADGSRSGPGSDMAYVLSLPSMAATAFYHHKLPTQPAALEPFLTEVEHFATTDYLLALAKGADLGDADKRAVAEKLHGYTGLPVDYLLRADLRVNGGGFSKMLQLGDGLTTGRLDSRYAAPDIDPLSSEAEYDPQGQAITSAYTTAINSYARETLKYGDQMTYKPGAYGDPGFDWDMRKGFANFGRSTNVMTDLANCMKGNPKLKVMLLGGYFDLGTLYFGAEYEMKHLQIPAALQKNISYHFYESGHMVYLNESIMKRFHDDTAEFIRGTENGK
ncbi:peptidase S10 [Terriglobus albidus]|uniref:Peptidase S10 n=1 Tax=Terriglobus albidus TaxID=1592106 RepID=A0A5B9ELR0_9BACT|nr:peptidase S10 [Terriglobus albidus]QEE31066.1 peptidase S10 [Terriglobus albidus]